MSIPESARLIEDLTLLLVQAAAAVAAVSPSAAQPRVKPDGSPVTAADEAAQAAIVEGLGRLLPQLPVVTEEAEGARPPLRPGEPFALVDPLDGTREYLAGRDEYTVNLAIVRDGIAEIGLIAAPALHAVWRGIIGTGSERLDYTGWAQTRPSAVVPLRTRPRPPHELVVTVSRSHLDAETGRLLARLPDATVVRCGSSLKFCRLAEGSADIYPRLAQVHEWDIAAGHAIVAAAGGTVRGRDGVPPTYGHADRDFRLPGFVAFGDPATRLPGFGPEP
jgi:3'(2'), 5'-bisphosphate nucleotidase